jgi:PAS domain S-box-containing protein
MSSKSKESKDKRLEEVLEFIIQLSSGNLEARGKTSKRNDEMDAIITGMNILAEESQAQIAERKESEEALRESKENMETILNSVEEGIMVIGKDHKIVEVNPAIERATKLPKEKIIGKHCYEISHHRDSPCEPPDDICPLKEVLKTGKPFTVTHKHFDKDGNVSYIELVASPVVGKDGEITGVIEVSRDVTERKHMEKALRESEEQFRELFESSMDAMYILDTEGRFTSVNRAMEEMTGYKKGELLGTERLKIVDGEDREAVEACFSGIVSGKEPLPIEFHFAAKEGGKIDVEVRSTPIFEEGSIVGVQESARDVSFRKALENELANMNEELTLYSQKLEQSNQLKGLFTDILRHDLLNPTGVIRNITEIMEYDENLKGSQELEVIKRNVTKLEEIIQNASQYAKLESEEALEKSELNLTELIENIISDFGHYAAEKKMKVKFKPDRDHKINASGAIESVFVNILSNAIKYSPEKTDIKIEVEDAGKNKRISFIDQGDGILDENKESVFDRFTRKDKKGVKGTGLGLAITKRIVDLHKGKIWVEDNPEGKGTVFIVEIPK